jgi:alpha-D-ribose 1-methylphosphonate 5-triphosphate synthase subunit PhnH
MTPAAVVPLGVHTSQAVFRVLLDTLARPGTVRALPSSWVSLGLPPALCLPMALADLGVNVAVVGDDGSWARHLAAATGATVTEPADAWTVSCLTPLTADVVETLPIGTAEIPEAGARLCVTVDSLGTGPVELTLSGPGVPGRHLLAVDGIDPEALDALAVANGFFPAGIDTWLVTPDGEIAALSRSTRVERHPRRSC